MQFLLSPLNDQIDLGFGVLGHSFESAAQELDAQKEPTGDFHRHLPISFLYRHALELFLKSAVLIFHCKFHIPYRDLPWDGKPHILVRGKLTDMYKVHSVADLYKYVDALFGVCKPALDTCTKTDWTTPADVPKWINLIEGYDRKGTFFRYPVTTDPRKDAAKSGRKESSADDFFSHVSSVNSKPGVSLLLHDDDGNPTRAFTPNDESQFLDVLRKATSFFSSTHVALRMELCGGW